MADRNRIAAEQTRALSHPVRLGIMALFTRETTRSLLAEDLRADLATEDPETFGEFDAGQIRYHRARLQDAELLPT